MADRMTVKCVPFVESSFTYIVSGDFRTILCQDGLVVESVAEVASNDDYFLCIVEGDEEEEEDIEIDDNIACSSEESGACDDARHN